MASAEGPSLCSDELLVDEVRQRPVLYDQRLKTYRDKQLQYDAWLEVAGAMKQSVAEVQHRWSCLRQKFLRLRKTYVKSGSGAADVEKTWELMPHLMFLADAIQRRSLSKKDNAAAASLDGQSLESTSTVEGLCNTFYIDSTQDISPIVEDQLDASSLADALSVQSSDANACPVASPDEDEHFLLCLRGLLAIVDDRKKERIKLQIHSLLVEAAYPPDAEEP
ncbi:uncharacterized protein LOC125758643 [Rhipicephalus sanguineus]|uniref:uncharacterized protein LOC125758643 n=1 Tax=Rhipicephalus sanguineus TaxID=34632 RepID=UPI0020C384CC|nr:uncharacterized protein LOC125758643 [Rhipicephalus sanguineus]